MFFRDDETEMERNYPKINLESTKLSQPFRYKCDSKCGLVSDVFKRRGWEKEPIEGNNWDIHWCKLSDLSKIFRPSAPHLLEYQRVSHFRNCVQLTRKNLLEKNLRALRFRLNTALGVEGINEMNFCPRTFILPREHRKFLNLIKQNNPNFEVWILKPSAGSQGAGIEMVTSLRDYKHWRLLHDNNHVESRNSTPSLSSITFLVPPKRHWDRTSSTDVNRKYQECLMRQNLPHRRKKINFEGFVAQRYILNPFLYFGRKFDFRFFVLVASHFPLKAFMHREAFCRLSHKRYNTKDVHDIYTHLTNNAVQKKLPGRKEGPKITMEDIMEYIELKEGVEKKYTILNAIDNIVVKTLQSVQQTVHQDKHCFEIYGYDVILDGDLKPWLLEINSSPSFTPTNKDDYAMKCRVIDDTISVLDLEHRLTGNEKRVGGWDLFWNGGPVYALPDVDNQRIKSNGKRLPKLNTFLGGYNEDRVDQLRQIYRMNMLIMRMTGYIPQKAKHKLKDEDEQSNGMPKIPPSLRKKTNSEIFFEVLNPTLPHGVEDLFKDGVYIGPGSVQGKLEELEKTEKPKPKGLQTPKPWYPKEKSEPTDVDIEFDYETCEFISIGS